MLWADSICQHAGVVQKLDDRDYLGVYDGLGCYSATGQFCSHLTIGCSCSPSSKRLASSEWSG
jgi:hypothetical protein